MTSSNNSLLSFPHKLYRRITGLYRLGFLDIISFFCGIIRLVVFRVLLLPNWFPYWSYLQSIKKHQAFRESVNGLRTLTFFPHVILFNFSYIFLMCIIINII